MDHDVSFRPGIGADGGETYTPRTLLYDLKGAFGTLRRENALYELQQQENPAQQGPWSGRTESLQLPRIAASPYQAALDAGTTPPPLSTSTVRFWSDYNHVFYHPRSIVQIQEYELNSSLMPFEQWSKGEELFANLDREHDLLDRDLRPFLEECDQLQGIQIFSGTDDAWGGFASKYLERVNDELGKGCRWVFGLSDSQRTTRDRQSQQLANIAQSLYALDSSASIHVPIHNIPAHLPDYASLDASSQWSTSALQAAAVESITLPTRLRGSQSGRATFDTLETTLNGDGNRRIMSLALSAKVNSDTNSLRQVNGANGDTRMTNGFHENGEDHEEAEDVLDIDFFPQLAPRSAAQLRQPPRRPHTFSRLSALRGDFASPLDEDHDDTETRRRQFGGPRTSTHQSDLLFPILSSYPASLLHFPSRPEKLSTKTTLSAVSEISDRLRSMGAFAGRITSVDERETLCDGLAAMADEYEEGWISDSEDDDD